MKYLAWLALFACASCASANYSKAIHVRAYSPDGKGGLDSLTEEQFKKEFDKQGVIFEFNEGDVIHYDFKPRGNLLEPVEGGRLRVKQKTYLYVSKRGPRISLDGKEFSKFHPHAFGFGLYIPEEKKQNQLDLNVDLKAPEPKR